MTPLRTVVSDDELQLREFLFQMDPIAFERHVMGFLEEGGHPTGLTPRSNDFGVDGYVFHPDGIIVVQCNVMRPTMPLNGLPFSSSKVVSNKSHRQTRKSSGGSERLTIGKFS